MAKKKINPRNKPATVADVKAAYKMGKLETVEIVTASAILSASDTFNPTKDAMISFHRKYVTNFHAILDGEIKLSDVLETLRNEYDIELEFE